MKNFFIRLFPILTWLPAYNRQFLFGDLTAGVTIGVMLIPQGMAYALIAGLPPVYGLYASLVPQLIYALLGTSRQLSVAPAAMDSLLVASGVSVLATQGTDSYLQLAILVALIMGVLQILFGVFRLGFIANLLSKPVISGFTSAAALIIAISQLPHLMGIRLPEFVSFKLSGIDGWALLIGLTGLLLILTLRRVSVKIPGALVAVIFGSLLVYFLRLDQRGVDVVREVPSGLPNFQLPNFDLEKILALLPLAATLALVAFMEAFSVSKSIESKRKDHKVRPNHELIALGASNAVGSLFQSFPVTGGFSRTAVNFQSGAQTPMASVISAAVIGITLIFLTPAFYFLPKAILASIILVAVVSLFDVAYVKKLWHDSKAEFALLIVTFFVTIQFSMVPGILTGILLSIFLLLYRAANPHIAELGRVKGYHEFRNVNRFADLETWNHFLILRIDAPISFINIQYVKEYVEIRALARPAIQKVIIDAGPISHLDATGANGLRDLNDFLISKGIQLVLCDVIGPVRDILFHTGLITSIGEENVFMDLNEAVSDMNGLDKQIHRIALQHND